MTTSDMFVFVKQIHYVNLSILRETRKRHRVEITTTNGALCRRIDIQNTLFVQ